MNRREDGFYQLNNDFAPRIRHNYDGGVGVKYYPSRRFVIRFDAGDTIIHYRKLTRQNFEGFPPTPQFPLKIGGGTTHNAQYSASFGIRF